MPPLTEENRRDVVRQARQEAEQGRVAVRNIRRDAIADVRELVKDKEVAEDDGRRSEEQIQTLTDQHVASIDAALDAKEKDLMEI